jgi:hypothetical protein
MRERNVAWIIPAINTKINGLAGGLIINSLKDEGDSLTTVVNGVSVELFGVGLFVPLAPSDPMFREPDSIYQNLVKRDSIIKTYNKIKYKINGIALSGGGLGGHDIGLNGINISGINALTGKVNGISLCVLMNYSGVVNGISAAILYNGTIQTKGVQIGLFNRTTKLRGFQLGLWNVNEKRSLPFINWNFR